jgi:tyrosinase
MWPWVGAAAGFDLDIEPAVRALLPDFSTSPTRTVKQVLDTETIDPTGYRYAPPSSS